MRSARLKTGWAAVLIYACVAILLVAGTVEAAHICGLQTAEIHASAQQESASSPSGPFCLMCLIIHSVVAILVSLMAFSLLMRRAPGRCTNQVQFIPLFVSFQLNVRPPPAF
jgi:hypothetical protein